MSDQSDEIKTAVKDALFQKTVIDYIAQDTKDKVEIKADLKAVREEQQATRVNIAVLKTKAGFIGAISAAIIAGIIEWISSFFHGPK